MSNEYFNPASVPAPNAPGSSAVIRGEFASLAAAFDKLPVMAGSADEFVVVNSAGTALVASGFSAASVATLSGAETLANKTLNWDDNTWVGFGISSFFSHQYGFAEWNFTAYGIENKIQCA